MMDLVKEDQIGKAAAEALWALLKVKPLVIEVEDLDVVSEGFVLRLNGRITIKVVA